MKKIFLFVLFLLCCVTILGANFVPAGSIKAVVKSPYYLGDTITITGTSNANTQYQLLFTDGKTGEQIGSPIYGISDSKKNFSSTYLLPFSLIVGQKYTISLEIFNGTNYVAPTKAVTKNITISNRLPSGTINAVNTPPYYLGNTITISGIAMDLDTPSSVEYQLLFNNVVVASGTTNEKSEFSYSYILSKTLKVGSSYNIVLKVKDYDKKFKNCATKAIMISDTPLTAKITKLTEGPYYRGTQITIEGEAYDPDTSTNTAYQLTMVDSKSKIYTIQSSKTDITGKFSFTYLLPTTMPLDKYKLYLWVRDNGKTFIQSPDSKEILIENQKPKVEITEVIPSAIYQGTKITIKGKAQDIDTSTSTAYEIKLIDSSNVSYLVKSAVTPKTGLFTVTYTIPINMNTGDANLALSAADDLTKENITTSKAIKILSRVSGNIGISPTLINWGTKINLTVTDVSAKYVIQLDGKNIFTGTVTASPVHQYTIPNTLPIGSIHKISLMVYDSVLNKYVLCGTYIDFKVENRLPTGIVSFKDSDTGTQVTDSGTFSFGHSLTISGTNIIDLDLPSNPPDVKITVIRTDILTVPPIVYSTSGGAILSYDLPKNIFSVGGIYSVKVEAIDKNISTQSTLLGTVIFTVIGLEAKYYSYPSNEDPSFKTLRYTRIDPKIDFDWSNTRSPDGDTGITKVYDSGTGVGPDYFAVDWKSTIVIPVTAEYKFFAWTDDGVRLYIDGTLVIDQWNDHSAAEYMSALKTLSAGVHTINMQYYEKRGYAVAKLSWQQTGGPKVVYPSMTYPVFNPPEGAYNSSQNVTISPSDTNLSNFTIYYTTDGTNPTSASKSVQPINITTNTTIKAAIQKNGILGDVVTSNYIINTNNDAALGGFYYNGTNFNTFVYTREDSIIDFDWGTGSPNTVSPYVGVGTDNFSVIWLANFTAPVSGTYTFITYSDDGVNLWVNNQNIITDWLVPHSVKPDTGTISLVAGQVYPLKMEYYENGGNAVAKLHWILPSGPTELPFPLSGNLTFTPADGIYSTVQNVSILGAPNGAEVYYTLNGTAPSKNNGIKYTGIPINIANTLTLNAVYIQNGVTSPIFQAMYVIGQAVDTIGGNYYKGIKFNKYIYNKPDTKIDFNWGTSSPDVPPIYSGVPADQFSVRWLGFFTAPISGDYTFITYTDDGVKLWINGIKLIDDWNNQATKTNISNTVTLTAGQSYTFKMEYYENTGSAVARLHWKIPGNNTEFVFPDSPANLKAYKDNTQSVQIYPQIWSNTGTGKKIYFRWSNSNTSGYKYSYTLKKTYPSASTILSAVNVGVVFLDQVSIPEDGKYTFTLSINDSNNIKVMNDVSIDLWIDDTAPVVTNTDYASNNAADGYKVYFDNSKSKLWINGGQNKNILKSSVNGTDLSGANVMSGIKNYLYDVRNSANMSQSVSSGVIPAASLTNPFTINPVALQHLQKYIVQIQAVDNAGNISPIVASTGVYVDTAPPTLNIYDLRTGVEPLFTARDASWTNGGLNGNTLTYNFTIADGGVVGSPQEESGYDSNQKYKYSVVDSNNNLVYSEDTSSLSAAVDCQRNLTQYSVTYIQTIQAEDRVGNVAMIMSNGINVDRTPPDVSGVTINNYLQDGTMMASRNGALWTNGGNDNSTLWYNFNAAIDPNNPNSSGIDRYEYALGNTAGGSEIINWTPTIVNSTSTTVSNAQIGAAQNGVETFYQNIRVYDVAGNVAVVNGAKIMIDKELPIMNPPLFWYKGDVMKPLGSTSNIIFDSRNDAVKDNPITVTTNIDLKISMSAKKSTSNLSGIKEIVIDADGSIISIPIPSVADQFTTELIWAALASNIAGSPVRSKAQYNTISFYVVDYAGNKSTPITYTNVSFDSVTKSEKPKIIDVEINSYDNYRRMILTDTSTTGAGIYQKQKLDSKTLK